MATVRRKRSEPFSLLQRDPGPWSPLLLYWLATLGIIVVFGLVMLYSASYTTGYLRFGDSLHYIKSQVLCLGLGLLVMIAFSYVDHRFLRKMVWPGYIVCLVLLVLVLFSTPLNGCRRWLRIAGQTVQVSEIAKFEMILLTAHLAAKAPKLEKLDPSRNGRVPVRAWLQRSRCTDSPLQMDTAKASMLNPIASKNSSNKPIVTSSLHIKMSGYNSYPLM